VNSLLYQAHKRTVLPQASVKLLDTLLDSLNCAYRKEISKHIDFTSWESERLLFVFEICVFHRCNNLFKKIPHRQDSKRPLQTSAVALQVENSRRTEEHKSISSNEALLLLKCTVPFQFRNKTTQPLLQLRSKCLYLKNVYP